MGIEFDHLPQMNDALHKAVFKAAKQVAKAMVKEAKERAPKRTGKLADSIDMVATDSQDTMEVEVVVGAEYAPDVEYGTRHMAARPFLTPAADAVAPKLEQELEGLEEVLSQVQ